VGEVELADVPQMEEVRARLLGRAQRFYLAFVDQGRNDPRLLGDVARGYRRLGFIRENLGDYESAERDYLRAIALQRPPAATDPAARAELAQSCHGLATLLKKSNRFQEAEAAFREALALREALAEASPADPSHRQALAQARYHLGALRARLRGQTPADEAAYRDAVAIQRGVIADARGKPANRRELGRFPHKPGPAPAPH